MTIAIEAAAETTTRRTWGIPSFRKSIQKARQIGLLANLGGLFLRSAFHLAKEWAYADQREAAHYRALFDMAPGHRPALSWKTVVPRDAVPSDFYVPPLLSEPEGPLQCLVTDHIGRCNQTKISLGDLGITFGNARILEDIVQSAVTKAVQEGLGKDVRCTELLMECDIDNIYQGFALNALLSDSTSLKIWVVPQADLHSARLDGEYYDRGGLACRMPNLIHSFYETEFKRVYNAEETVLEKTSLSGVGALENLGVFLADLFYHHDLRTLGKPPPSFFEQRFPPNYRLTPA